MSEHVLISEDELEEVQQEQMHAGAEDKNARGESEAVEPDGQMEPYEAYVRCMRAKGRADLRYLIEHTGRSKEELIEGLELYQDPARYDARQEDLEDWYPVSAYMYNHHIPRLYQVAREMNEKYPGRFERNIRLLEEHYPKLCGITAYDLPIGTRLVPNWVYGEIFRRILELLQAPDVSYNEDTERYTIKFKERVPNVLNHVEYGTRRKGISEAIGPLMNGEDIVVSDEVPGQHYNTRPKYVRNDAETVALLARVREFLTRYYHELAELLEDPQVYEQINERYCRSIGGYYKSQMRCDWVKVPGLDHVLRDYQKDGIGRAVMNPVTFFAWGTGAGKSLGMLAAASEIRRLDICRKLLMVVPNSSLENFVVEIEKYFPQGNFLIIYPRQFTKRKPYYLNKIRTEGDQFDAVVMSISTYMLLDMSADYYRKENEAKLQKARAALQSAMAANRMSDDTGILKRRIKTLEKQKEALALKTDAVTDCFDTLGFDGIFIDECQEFKNVSLRCGFAHISGVTTKGSTKCDRNMEKVHWIMRQSKDSEGRVVFATATPQKNSISETYVYQKYLSEEEMAYSGIHSFQEWMKNFTETETKPGVAQDLQNMTLQTRLKYHNLTDLHAMMSPFMHYYRVDRSALKLPDHKGYESVILPATADEIARFEMIAEKLMEWHEGILTSQEYNPLLATIEGRAASTDIRLTDPDVIPAPDTTKAEHCGRKTAEVYFAYPGTTQVVFCDLSTPKPGFNLYDEMKKSMVQHKIPAEEIAYIHDADNPVKKKQLLEDFQAGRIRVLIGSTQKLGVGLNIHRKLKAVHHFDCPYSPADLIQRNGRALREGNENEEVLLFRYIKERSYDAVSWDRVEMKQGWIEAFNSPLVTEKQRNMEDLADNSLSYGEAVAYALGKPEMRLYVETQNELKRELIASRRRSMELQELKEFVASAPEEIVKRENYVMKVEGDLAHYERSRTSMTDEQRRQIGTTLLKALKRARAGEEVRGGLRYQGFRVTIPAQEEGKPPCVLVHGVNGVFYRVKMETEKEIGCCQILSHFLGTELKRIRLRHEKRAVSLRQDMRHAYEEIAKGNEHSRVLEELRSKLEEMEKALEL